MHSVVTVAMVRPLATVNSQPSAHCMCCVVSSVFLLVCLGLHSLPSPSIIYLGSLGVVTVLPVCSHVGSFYWPVYFSFFHSLISTVFIIIIILLIAIFILLWSILICFQWMSFSLTGAHFCVVLILLFLPFLGQRLMAGFCIPRERFYLAGVELMANCRVVFGT